MEILLTLLPFAIIASFTPGPNNILVMSRGINYGFRSTVAYQVGAGIGCFCIIGGVLLLGAQVEKLLPQLILVMRYLGCAYMVWLAWAVLRSSAVEGGEGQGQERVTWRTGFILQFVNPKFYLYAVTLAAAIIPLVPNSLKISLYSLFFAFIAVAGMLLWAVAGAVLQRFLGRWRRPVNAVMALALVWCAWSLL